LKPLTTQIIRYVIIQQWDLSFQKQILINCIYLLNWFFTCSGQPDSIFGGQIAQLVWRFKGLGFGSRSGPLHFIPSCCSLVPKNIPGIDKWKPCQGNKTLGQCLLGRRQSKEEGV
jgi:hypothetical protein